MKPFLYNVAKLFYDLYEKELTSYAFVFPNRRAGIFFQKQLAEISPKPILSPDILTISDLFSGLSKIQLADTIGLLFEIYDVYIKVSQSTESFDDFVFWGEMLLSDFDDVDKYLVDPKQLFTNITDLKEIDTAFNFLTEDQIKIIRKFWSHFIPVEDNKQKKDFLQIWEVLYPVYFELTKRLLDKNIGYEGLIYRNVIENIKKNELNQVPFEKIIFIGFNALNKAEKELFSYFKNIGKADFYWDYYSDWVNDPDNKASLFIKENKRLFPSNHALPYDVDLFDNRPEFILTGIPSAVGQAKEMNRILNQLYDDNHLSANAINTAVVLPNENLLMPVLHAVPSTIERINVTMGYPLNNTSIDGLMTHIIQMQRNIRTTNGSPCFYYKYVLPILNHRYIVFLAPEISRQFISEIQSYNRFFIKQEDIPKHPVFELIFSIPQHVQEVSEYLLQLLNLFQQAISDINQNTEESFGLSQLEKEFIYRYYLTVNRVKDIFSCNQAPEMSIDSYFKLLKKLIDTVSIPFVGEPLSGLQIMGTLETRALNFDNIIILSMNEGVYPKKESIHSFIPYNLRRGFNLPTYEHQDAVFAYNFYRMIATAKRVFMIYDTRADGMQTGEVSRFVYQLKYHYHVPVKEKLIVFDVKLNAKEPISISKNTHVQQQLNRFLKGGDKALSASAINTYINCPLKFYLSYVEGLSKDDEISETVESGTFGSIFHQVMQDIYDPLSGRMVQDDILLKIKNDDKFLTSKIEDAFAKYFHKGVKHEKLVGQNFLIGEIIRKYVKQMLDIDRKKTPFTYIRSEMLIHSTISLSSQKEVRLKGFIDRIDTMNGVIRILDYKTGKGTQVFKNIPHLFQKTDENRPKDLMQVLMYCLLYAKNNPASLPIEPGIYYLRSLFSTQFDTRIIQKETNAPVDDFSLCRDEFESEFISCLDEIFDFQRPFEQTQITKHCEYCPFSEICG